MDRSTTATDILRLMEDGAQLHKAPGASHGELRIRGRGVGAAEIANVPVSFIDALVGEGKIEHATAGFYRVIK